MKRHSTWLHRAAEAGHAGVIDFWLGRGWDVNRNLHESKSDGELTPLHHTKDAATTHHLLSRARVNAWSRYGGTPLHCAVIYAVEVSQRGRRRESPDSLADPIRVLLEAGADPALANFEGLTPLALAVQLRRTTAERALRRQRRKKAAGRPDNRRRPRPSTSAGTPVASHPRSRKPSRSSPANPRTAPSPACTSPFRESRGTP